MDDQEKKNRIDSLFSESGQEYKKDDIEEFMAFLEWKKLKNKTIWDSSLVSF